MEIVQTDMISSSEIQNEIYDVDYKNTEIFLAYRKILFGAFTTLCPIWCGCLQPRIQTNVFTNNYCFICRVEKRFCPSAQLQISRINLMDHIDGQKCQTKKRIMQAKLSKYTALNPLIFQSIITFRQPELLERIKILGGENKKLACDDHTFKTKETNGGFVIAYSYTDEWKIEADYLNDFSADNTMSLMLKLF